MKRLCTVLLAVLTSFYAADGQLSFKEKRQRDKALNEGIEYMLDGNLELASSILTDCIGIDSTFAPPYLMRGRILMEWGALSDAMDDINQAIELDPDYGEAEFYKGYLLYGRDTTGTDAILFNKAIQDGFQDPWAYYFRGLTELRDSLERKALNDFNRAVELKDDFSLAYHERAGIKRNIGDLQGALFDYKTAIDYDDDFALAYNNMASVKILLGDYEGAVQDYTSAIEKDPEMYMAYNNRGYAKYFLNDLDGALQDFDAAITLNDDFSLARLNKSSVLAKQNNVEAALNLLDNTIEVHPDKSLLYVNRGLIRELTGDLSGACADWTQAKELGSDQVDEYLTECK